MGRLSILISMARGAVRFTYTSIALSLQAAATRPVVDRSICRTKTRPESTPIRKGPATRIIGKDFPWISWVRLQPDFSRVAGSDSVWTVVSDREMPLAKQFLDLANVDAGPEHKRRRRGP